MNYKFSKGELELNGNHLRGWVKASTDFQHEMPSQMDIDTTADKVGPINISEVKQFRIILTWSVLFPILCIVFCILGMILAIIIGGGQWLFSLIGVGVACWLANKFGPKWFTVYMAKFSNNGQTVYIPFIKEKEHSIIVDLENELKKVR